jgi:hypothetical protein
VAITIETVRAGLRAVQLKFIEIDDKTTALGFGGSSTTVRLVLSLQEDGEYLEARTLGLATCPLDGPRRAQVTELLNKHNLHYRLCSFSLDPTDGEIFLRSSLPLEDSTALPNRQLQGLILGLVAVSDQVYPELAQLAGTGSASKPGSPATTAGKKTGIGCLLALAAAAAMAYFFAG